MKNDAADKAFEAFKNEAAWLGNAAQVLFDATNHGFGDQTIEAMLEDLSMRLARTREQYATFRRMRDKVEELESE